MSHGNKYVVRGYCETYLSPLKRWYTWLFIQKEKNVLCKLYKDSITECYIFFFAVLQKKGNDP